MITTQGLCPSCTAQVTDGPIGFAATNPPCRDCKAKAKARIADEPDAVALLKHARKHYTDWMVAHDADRLTGATSSPIVTAILKSYLAARRAAPGFTRGFAGAGSGNSDRAIHAEVVAGLVERATESARMVGSTKPCESCGSAFVASRSTARFCGPTCRQQSRRTVDGPKNAALSVTSAANVQVRSLPESGFFRVGTEGPSDPFEGLSVTCETPAGLPV